MINPLADPVVLTLGPLLITSSVVTTWAIMATILTVGIILSGLSQRNTNAQEALLALVDLIDAETRAALGKTKQNFLPFLVGLFVLIATANISSLVPGAESPTARPETTAALALVVMSAVQVAAIRQHGFLGFAKHFLRPHPLFLPLNLIGEVTRVLSLMMRLFGNMMSHGVVIAILLSIVGFLVPIPFMALGLLIGLVQAYIFTMLAAVYIAAAIQDEEV